MGKARLGSALALLGALACLGCDEASDPGEDIPVVDFGSDGAASARAAACAASYADGARVGAAREPANAPILWSVSPYWVLLPSDGVGYVNVNVDAPHYDWLLFTDETVLLEVVAGPEALSNGAVAGCEGVRLQEIGAHHHDTTMWSLRLTGEPGARVRLYAGVAATPHSDPSEAGHAAHADEDAVDHAH